MNDSQLNDAEFQVLQDATYFATRAALDAKMELQLSELKALMMPVLESLGNIPAPSAAARIYRGEHLGIHPWRAIDLIRQFEGKQIRCLRFLVAYGQAFSLHLILSGQHLEQGLPRLSSVLPYLAKVDFKASLAPDPWDWNPDSGKWVALKEEHLPQILEHTQSQGFLKLSKYWPLSEWPSHSLLALDTLAALVPVAIQTN